MNEGIRVVIADSSEDFCRLISDRLGAESDITVAAVASNGTQALEACVRENPDVLIMDLLLKELDGIAVFRELRERGMMTKVIIVTGFFNDTVAARLSQLGVDWLMPKPCSVNELAARVREVCVCDVPAAANYDTDISDALLAFGIAPNHNGFKYLVIAVRARIIDHDALCGITKVLYPDIAKRFCTNSQSVERCIREAICSAWKDGNARLREDYFGNCIQQLTTRPTNSRLISFFAEFIVSKRSARQSENVNTN